MGLSILFRDFSRATHPTANCASCVSFVKHFPKLIDPDRKLIYADSKLIYANSKYIDPDRKLI